MIPAGFEYSRVASAAAIGVRVKHRDVARSDVVTEYVDVLIRRSICKVTTIEGLADDDTFHPTQEGFRQCHGPPCGYCTPGMMIAVSSLLDDMPDPTEEEVRLGLERNICR